MYCSSCGQKNSPDTRFCSTCGQPSSQLAYAPGGVAVPAGYPQQLEAPTAYAGFWIRVLAELIDWVLLNIVSFSIGFVLGLSLGDEGAATALSVPLSFAVNFLYSAILESSDWQATVGKRICGLRVVDEHGQRISFGRAVGRTVSKILSGCLLGIGYLMVAFSDRKQGLHDQLVKTLVVRS